MEDFLEKFKKIEVVILINNEKEFEEVNEILSKHDLKTHFNEYDSRSIWDSITSIKNKPLQHCQGSSSRLLKSNPNLKTVTMENFRNIFSVK